MALDDVTNRVSIVLVEESEQTELVRKLILDWAQQGVISGTVAWVTQGLRDGDCSLISASGQITMGLTDYLARQDGLSLLRVVTLQIVADSEKHAGVPPHGSQTMSKLETYKAAAQRIAEINLIVPSTDIRVNTGWLLPLPATNLVAVPEDCSTDRAFASPVTPGAELGAHAAFVLAAVCGLWAGVETNPFDLRPGNGPGSLPQGNPNCTDGVRLIRCYGRVMICRDVVDESLMLVISQRLDPGFPPSNLRAVLAPDERIAVQTVTDSFVSTEQFRYAPFKSSAAPKRVQVGFIQALKSLVNYLWQKLHAAPHRAASLTVSALQEKLGEVTQRVVYGKDSIMQVVVGQRAEEYESESDPLGQEKWASRLASQWVNSTQVQPTPVVWSELRKTALGMLDGCDLPERMAPRDQARFVVSSPNWVGPDPLGEPLDPEIQKFAGVSINACDPMAVAAIEKELSKSLEEVRERLRERAAKHAGTGEAGMTPEREQADEADNSEMSRLYKMQESLMEWTSKRRLSLLWRVGEVLGTQVATAHESFANALQSGKNVINDLESASRKKIDDEDKRLNKSWKRWSLFSILAILAAIAGFFFVAIVTLPILTAFVAGIVLLWLAKCTVSYLLYERRIFALQHQLEVGLHRQLNDLSRVEHAAREFGRLQGMYTQYLDWAEVLSFISHHPEGPKAIEPTDRGELPSVVRPKAVEIGIGRISEDHSMQLVARVAQQRFGRSWLNDLYSQYEDTAMTRWRLRMNASGSADPNSDTSARGSRHFLLTEVHSGRLADDWLERLTDSVRVSVGEDKPSELFQRVDLLAQGGEILNSDPMVTALFFDNIIPLADEDFEAAQNPRRFKPSYWTDVARLEREVTPLPDTFVWVPSGIEGKALAVIAPERVKELEMETLDGSLRISALRIDVSAEISSQDLSLFEPSEDLAPSRRQATFGGQIG